MTNALADSEVVQNVGYLLLHSVWQFALIAIVLGTVLRFALIKSQARYWACVLGLTAMAIAPLATSTFFLENASNVTKSPKSSTQVRNAIALPPRLLTDFVTPIDSNNPTIAPGTIEGVHTDTESPVPESFQLSLLVQPWFPHIVLGWFLGVFAFAIRPVYSWAVLQGMRREGVAVPRSIVLMLDASAHRMKVTRHVRALESMRVTVPMVLGYLRPIILLPASAVSGLTAAELEAIFLHELAHIRRHDYIVNFAQVLLETVFFYHPAVWWLSMRVRHEREHCCDEMAAATLGNRSEYGRALLALEKYRAASPVLALGARGGSLVSRIERLAGKSPRCSNVGVFLFTWIVLAIIAQAMWTGRDAQAQDDTDNANSNWEAKAIAVRAHSQASAIDSLPRFLIHADASTRSFKALKNPAPDSLTNLLRAIDEPIVEKDWWGYSSTFAWNGGSFLNSLEAFHAYAPDQPEAAGENPPTKHATWGTPRLGGYYSKFADQPVTQVLKSDAKAMWKDMTLSNPNYFLITTHELSFGDNSYIHQNFNMIPASEAMYRKLDTVKFDGERCHLLESKTRLERLWVGCDTGLIRGYVQLNFVGEMGEFYKSEEVEKIAGRKFANQHEYSSWWRQHFEDLPIYSRQQLNKVWAESLPADDLEPGLLVRFRDFREIRKGVWWPFREDRAQGFTSDKGYECMLTTYSVKEVRLDDDLSKHLKAVFPQPGEKVQDVRYAVPISYRFGDKTEEELHELVDAEYAKRLESKAAIKRLQEPYADLVGKPAIELPRSDWVGGPRPNIAGKPYLIHFWATWCGPCKNDFPILRRLAKTGIVIGMHPAGTAIDDVEKTVADAKLGYPTFVSANENSEEIAGYPGGMFPYCVVVDANGKVNSHGFLTADDNKLFYDFLELNGRSAPDAASK